MERQVEGCLEPGLLAIGLAVQADLRIEVEQDREVGREPACGDLREGSQLRQG